MNEKEWTNRIAALISEKCLDGKSKYQVSAHQKLPYGYEITGYADAPKATAIRYETDLLVSEHLSDGSWIPRVVIEVKLKSVGTHAAITYSQKAMTHKAVHPYLRYGIILGDRRAYPLPGRLYRHGGHFDFMFSFVGLRPTKREITKFRGLLRDEISASRLLQKIIYESKKPGRNRYTLLQRKLRLEVI